MAETKRKPDRKEKKSLQDDEIGDEFLGSWKKMSVPVVDAMDFNFEAVPKENKKAFNFGNMDMDFNLDGDFDKISNFKVDMADLDFSSPSEDASKSKAEQKGGSSSGRPKGGLDPFDFSFDFNGLDDFNIDGKLTKGDEAPGKLTEKKGDAIKDVEWHDPKIMISQGTDGSESSQTAECPAPEKAINEMVKGIGNSLRRDDSRRPEALGDHIEHAAKEVRGEIVGVTLEGTNQESPSLDEGMSTDQGNPSSAEGMSTDQGNPSSVQCIPIDQCAEYALQSTLSQSLGRSDSIQDTTSDVQPVVDCLDSGADTKSEEVSVNDDNQLSKSAPLFTNDQDVKNGENNEIFSESTAEDTREIEPVSNDKHAEAILTGSLPLGKPNDCDVIEDNQQASYLVSIEKEPATDRVELTMEEDARLVRSKFLRKSGDVKPSLASSGVQKSVFGSSPFALKQLNRPGTVTRSSDVQTGRNLGNQLKSLSREWRKGVPSLGGGKNVKSALNPSKDHKDGGGQDNRTPTDTAILPNRVVALGEPGVLRSVSNKKDPAVNSCYGTSILTDKMPNLNITRNLNSSVAASSMKTIHDSKIIPVKAVKFDKQMPSLSSLHISRDTEVSRDQANAPSKPLKGISKATKTQENATAQIGHPVTEEQTTLKSLKRNSEAFNADLMPLNPHKRISPLRDTSRKMEDKTEAIIEEQVQICNSEVANEFGSMLHDITASGVIISKDVNLEKPVTSLATEIDRVQMAAECGRKLDALCSKMRKMMEDAKELSVQSIVNSNRLLLLNHPMVDEKIRVVRDLVGRPVDD